jgi:hypothetical protein
VKKNHHPDWAKWRQIPEWHLWEAVALSLAVEPDSITWESSGLCAGTLRVAASAPDKLKLDQELKRRATIVERVGACADPGHVGLRLVDHHPLYKANLSNKIRPADFLGWVRGAATDWTIPPELVELAEHSQLTAHPTSDGSQTNSGLTSARWPWGNYETDLLRCLEAAARRFWVRYDSTDPTTAHTVEDVANWLQSEFNLSQNKAQAIATILRADGLPTGPRREK